MEKNQRSYYFLLFALAAAGLVMYLIAKPFLGPLIMAAVFAFLFQPAYRRLTGYFRGRGSWAALATIVLATVLIVVPISFLGAQIFKESSRLYQSLVSDGKDGFFGAIEGAAGQALAFFPVPAGIELDLGQYARQGLDALIRNLGGVFSSFAKMMVNAFVFLIAFYYFLKDGAKLRDYFIALSPLADDDDRLIESRLKLAVAAAVKGNLAIGLVQGTLTGIGFALFGVPNPALWGAVAAIAALIPGLGTALVITPAIVYQFLGGNTLGGIGLLVWGMTAVGLVDNLLGPKLVGRGMHLHPLAVFVSVLGGLAFFGPLGFLLGPLAMSVCLALVDIYFSLKSNPAPA